MIPHLKTLERIYAGSYLIELAESYKFFRERKRFSVP